jgi:peptidyl-prolyl cis-trans isomerase D
MAILGKIRERSMFLIIIIALALFSFVLTGLFDSNSPLFNKDTNYVGEINGEKIAREDFAQLVDQERARTGGRVSQLQNVKTAWDNLVKEKVYKTQLEKSGIIVGEKDVWDAIVSQPFVQNSAIFKNEVGLFDQEKLKEYIATLKDDSLETEEGKSAWLGWLSYEKSIKTNLELSTYSNLIDAGLGTSLKEGEYYYNNQNTKMDLQYVYVPFASIADSLVTITEGEIKEYVKAHKEDYIVEPTVNLSFVKFEVKASEEDEEIIKGQLQEIINDREEYSTAAKSNVQVIGLKNVTNYTQFFRENSSDTPLDTKFYTKNLIPKIISDTIVNTVVGGVYGPYKEREFLKISKLVEVKQLPDSVKSRHILVTYVGSRSADETITRSEEEAKILSDSLLTVLKNDKSKFVDFVTEFSSDKGSIEKGGKYDWYPYGQMVPEFRDFTFEGKTGDWGVVKTQFGFHIIEIEGQKNMQPAYRLATFSRKIEASEKTENTVFEKAETFVSNLTESKDIVQLAKDNNYVVQPIRGLKNLDERVSSLGAQREIVTWAFEKGTKDNDIKRFDIDNGYAVVKLNKKNKKGLSIGSSQLAIRKLLLDKKKAVQINDRMTASSLDEIAKEFNISINSSKAVSLGSPALPGVGKVPELIGGLTKLNSEQLYKNIASKNGVFAIKMTNKVDPTKLENYKSFTSQVAGKLQSKSNKAFDALKKFAIIEDNRATFY